MAQLIINGTKIIIQPSFIPSKPYEIEITDNVKGEIGGISINMTLNDIEQLGQAFIDYARKQK